MPENIRSITNINYDDPTLEKICQYLHVYICNVIKYDTQNHKRYQFVLDPIHWKKNNLQTLDYDYNYYCNIKIGGTCKVYDDTWIINSIKVNTPYVSFSLTMHNSTEPNQLDLIITLDEKKETTREHLNEIHEKSSKYVFAIQDMWDKVNTLEMFRLLLQAHADLNLTD